MVPKVNRATFASAVDAAEARKAAGSGAANRPGSASRPCFHCGEPCSNGVIEGEGHVFCCLGCRAVCALLTAGGLEQYYELSEAPGSRVKAPGEPTHWAFLDELSVQEKLLDFADERQARVTLHLPSIHCLACVWLLENLYRLNPGIGHSRVNFGRREVQLTYAPAQVKLSEVAALLASLGYEPALTFQELDRAGRARAPLWQQRQWLQIGVAGFGFGNVMLLALPTYLGMDSASGPWFHTLAGWLGLALALPVLVYSAADFWRAAWGSWRQRVMTMDVPIALGLLAIYGQSLFEVWTGRGVGYSDSLSGLIFFLLCGRVFQRKTFDHLSFDRDYKGFFPLAVLRKTPAGEIPVVISELAVGDRLLIRHHELIPADSRLVAGEASVDYSFVTGESAPVSRSPGDRLFAGGRQLGGTVEIETTKPVSESYLTSLWNHETFRKERDHTLDSLTNRYSRRFTLLILAVAVGSALYWLRSDGAIALKAFTSVLIVACPCALALAAPLTLGTAHRWLAQRGVFSRNAQVVEQLAEIDAIVLDKTGTLTTPGAGQVQWQGDALSPVEVSRCAALARQSTHPLAVGLSALAPDQRAPEVVSEFVEVAGRGLRGWVGSQRICLGSRTWLEEQGVRVRVQEVRSETANTDGNRVEADTGGGTGTGTGTGADAAPPSAQGSVVHVALDGNYRGSFALAGTLRPEVEEFLATLRGRFQLVLLSGDHAEESVRFQRLLGPDARVAFNQTPLDKLHAIQELQAAGKRVMMVGDGLNDAGALKQADVGVAVVEKVGTFSPASDIILQARQLARLGEVLQFSRWAARTVQAGFVLSGLYNLVGISIAAMGILSPLVCAILMPLSSASVVLFSVGLTRWLAGRAFVRRPVAPARSIQTDGSGGITRLSEEL